MHDRTVYATAGIALLILASAIVGACLLTPIGCRLIGGRWDGGPCTTPLCAYLGGCGEWAHAPTPCRSIPLGARRARVHFLLGEPSRRDAFASYWEWEKDPTTVRAVFRDDRLVDLACFTRW